MSRKKVKSNSLKRLKYRITYLLFVFIVSACSGNSEKKSETSKSESHIGTNKIEAQKVVVGLSNKDSLVLSVVEDSIKNLIKSQKLRFFYVHPYSELKLTKEYNTEKHQIKHTARVDTTDFIVKISKHNDSSYVVVGYNHLYDFIFTSKINGSQFSIHLDKKKDLRYLLEESDCWLESNLDAWSLNTFNSKYGLSVFEFDVNPKYNYGDTYYFVFDTLGKVINQGYHRTWGGEGADGKMYSNKEYLITCNEVYKFQDNSIKTYTKWPSLHWKEIQKLSKEEKIDLYKDTRYTHAMRVLNDSAFLVIFNKYNDGLEYNGIIFSMNLKELKKLKYYDFHGEMDAILLSNEKFSPDTLVLLDRIRKKLLFLQKLPPYTNIERDFSEMVKVKNNQAFESMRVLIRNDNMPEFDFRINKKGTIYYKMKEY